MRQAMNNPSDSSDEVRRLICEQVPEIDQGTVQVKGIVRDRGYGTIVAVHSTDARIQAVGAVVGERGVRIKTVVKQLNNEKIDVVRWEESIGDYLWNLFSPARISRVVQDPDSNRITIFAPSDQLAPANGRQGRKVQLVARLTGRQLIVMGDDR